jgi:hypothetical protein
MPIKKKCSTKRRRRFNVKGSPCNKLKKSRCTRKKGCTYVRCQGCRRARGFATAVVLKNSSKLVKAAETAAQKAKRSGENIEDQAIAGAQAASKVAVEIASEEHATVKEIHQTAVAAARVGAEKVVKSTQTDNPEQIISHAVAVVAKAPPPPPPMPPKPKSHVLSILRGKLRAKHQGLPQLGDLASEAVKKAKERQARQALKSKVSFGNTCKTLLPKDPKTCVNYTENGLYPCNWSGGKNARCQKRSNPKSTPVSGIYSEYVVQIPGFETMKPVKTAEPVAPKAAMEDETLSALCKRLGWNKCTIDPNCHRQNGPKTGKRCVAKPGTKGTKRIFHGPVNKNNNQSVPGTKEKMDFGRRKTKKVPDSIKATCKKLKIRLTRTVGGKRVPKALSLLKKQIKAKK